MYVCEKCKLTSKIFQKCSNCGKRLTSPKITDAFLKRFLEIDDQILKRFQEIQRATIKEAESLSLPRRNIKVLGISGSSRDAYDMASEDSNSEFLLKECLKELKKLKADVELISLRKFNIQPCKACYSTTNTQCHYSCSCYPKGTPTGDDMSNILYQKVIDADIIIFATPVNNFKISSYMALFIDRCISLDGSLAPADPKATKNKKLNITHTKYIELTSDEVRAGSGFLRRFIGKVGGVIVTGHEEGASLAISSLFMTLNHFGMIFPPWSNVYAMSSIILSTNQDKSLVRSSHYIDDVKKMAHNTYLMAQKLKKLPKQHWRYDYSSN